jgi:S1-C subfamily serine protease
MTKTATALAALLLAGLLGLTLEDFRTHVEDLHDRVRQSDVRIRLAQTEVARLRDDSRDRLRRVEAGADLTRIEIESLRSRLDRPDAEGLYREVLAPSIQVIGRGGVGGGTLLLSRPRHTYAVTAYHVVQKAVTRASGAEMREPIDVRVYDERGAAVDAAESDLVAYDERKDLALLRLRTERAYRHVARLASRETLRRTRVFAPIYAVGCPLGHDPLPTVGEIATLHKAVGGENFWMMNAPTIFGNSGGGVFHRQTRELLGVSVMLCTYDGAVSTPVPHLGILVSLETVYDWLDGLGLRFVYDPGAAPDACEQLREVPPGQEP